MSDDSRPSPPAAPSAARTAAVIPAAGRGVRLGPGAPKALRALGGTPMLIHAVRAMAASRAVSLVVVVAPPDGAAEVKSLLDAHALPERTDFLVVPGGETRQESVKLGLDALPPGHDIVLVHDAARPLVPVDTVDAVIEAVRDGAPAVVPGAAARRHRQGGRARPGVPASRSRSSPRRSARGCARCRPRRASTGPRWCGPTRR